VLDPRSIKLAPKEKKPFGIEIKPEATPESIDSNVLTLLFFSALEILSDKVTCFKGISHYSKCCVIFPLASTSMIALSTM